MREDFHMDQGQPIKRPGTWAVWRQDDNGNRFEVARYGSKAEAAEHAADLESRGHRQTYWVASAAEPT
jgi:hypothetical protein